MQHAVSWFDIPSRDFNRAVKFYNDIFQIEMVPMQGMDGPTAFFPMEPGGVGGCIVSSSWYEPSETAGPLIYLNTGEDVNPILNRVEAVGGRILVPKTSISEHGAIAVIIDSEGNRIGLHSLG